MNKDIRDEDLRQALITYYDAVTAALPDPAVLHYSYSPAHQARMERLIRSHERRDRRAFTLQRVAVVLLALLLTFSSWLAVDVHAREAFFNWVRTIYEDHIEYRFHGNVTTPDGLPDYELGWIPEGFELVEEDSDDRSAYQYFGNPGGDIIVFEYEFMADGDFFSYYGSTSEPEYIEINGAEGEIIRADDSSSTNNIIWTDEFKDIVFFLNSNIDIDTMMQIASSITK